MAEKQDDHRIIPDQKTLSEAGDLTVYDAQGKEIAFRSLYADKPQALLVFIRHFFCGACELYIQALHKALPQDKFPNTTISIIGCGAASLIADYRTRNSIPQNITLYADPERKVYSKLGMRSTDSPFMEGRQAKQQDYHQGKSFWNIVFSSGWNAIMSGPKAIKAGPPGQNGGAVVVRNGECVFVHRMRRVDDYADLGELERVLGEGGQKE